MSDHKPPLAVDTLDGLLRQEREVSASLSDLRARIATLRESIARESFGVEVGSIAIHRGKRYRVTGIRPTSWGGKPWLVGNPERADGTFGKAHRHLFSEWIIEQNPSGEVRR